MCFLKFFLKDYYGSFNYFNGLLLFSLKFKFQCIFFAHFLGSEECTMSISYCFCCLTMTNTHVKHSGQERLCYEDARKMKRNTRRSSAVFAGFFSFIYSMSSIFVAAFDESGNALLLQGIGDAASQYAEDIAVDEGDSIYLAASVQGDVDFGTGLLTAEDTSFDIVVARLAP